MNRTVPQHEVPTREALDIMRAMASGFAEGYIREYLVPGMRSAWSVRDAELGELRRTSLAPEAAIRIFYLKYAFCKRGRERDVLAAIALAALDRAVQERGFDGLLEQPEPGAIVWQHFHDVCAERGHRNSQQLNGGLIAGVIDLASELQSSEGDGSLSRWVVDSVERTGRLQPIFLRLVDIRGLGPKVASSLLRDLVIVHDIEEEIEHIDRLFVQPVDRWLRALARRIVPEFDGHTSADWIIAGKVAKYTRRAGVSGARFNMGSVYFGLRGVRDPMTIDDRLARALAVTG